MLERAHLEILRAIDRCGTLTAAAESLHLTQSALSHTMAKFERLSGVRLWSREGRSLRLTQAGQYVLGLAERLLPQFEAAEQRLAQYAAGERGTLRIGMECHPCYQWLLKLVSHYLSQWPDVDVDVKQKFRFGGMGALLNHEIDLLVTPDPLHLNGVSYVPVFDYEQVLAVSARHPLAGRDHVLPADLAGETLITYPVEAARLDIFSQFLLPAGVQPRRHKVLESTDITLEMVAGGRGVTALPRWLVMEYARNMAIVPLRLGPAGIAKQIHLGRRDSDDEPDYLRAFIELAGTVQGARPQ
ncbi:LysR family transcriptional regulator [Yanghanlia caeni]|uniref:HTH-type transcriptional regulator MetR n=1 Tax=Yanghanlia caeni TaxID=3064283 RepID=A0ABU1D7M7_9BURK|nr:LysR family transcriptional regulator [Alcaligenaceae bacterium LG-2]